MLTPEVEHTIDVNEDGQGGANVTVRDIDIGPRFAPPTVWIGFHLGIHYPSADVYPHFITRVARADGSALPAGLSNAQWQNGDATQASRRTNQRVDGEDDAVVKLWKVITWLRGL